MTQPSNIELLAQEGWTVSDDTVFAYGQEFPITDPINVHFKVYRTHPEPEVRYQAMKRLYELLWPDDLLTWNYWMERIFKAHCGIGEENGHWQNIALAAGAGVGKTYTIAAVCAIFFLANPQKRAVIVASTTLDSLKSRIFGYVRRALRRIAIPYAYSEERSPPPKIHPANKDDIHGIFAVSANRGDDEEAIKNWIGRHPEDSLLVVLDEGTEMPIAILNASANLEQGLKGTLQMICIGNSDDIHDLHGIMSTPLNGWESINPDTDISWRTTQPRGICLYFNPYESPAIHEEDVERKKALSNFLFTEEKLLNAERELGVDSANFWRFVMGFWQTRDTQTTVVSEAFLKDYDCTKFAEFSGRINLKFAAGLDPAFSAGGDKCLLRLGVLGHHVNGKVVLDFRGQELVFDIRIHANAGKSVELQIADQVIEILGNYKIPLHTLCVDASGAGRGLADVIALRASDPRENKWLHITGAQPPTKIYSTNVGTKHFKNFDIVITDSYEMWFQGRQFITHRQIYGLDAMAYGQMYNRQVETNKAGRKTLEKKAEFKKRMNKLGSLFGRSPDEADAAMLCLQSAILHHGFYLGQQIENIRFATDDDRAVHESRMRAQAQAARPTITNPKASYSKGLNSLLNRRNF